MKAVSVTETAGYNRERRRNDSRKPQGKTAETAGKESKNRPEHCASGGFLNLCGVMFQWCSGTIARYTRSSLPSLNMAWLCPIGQ